MSDVINDLNKIVKEVNAAYFPHARIAQLEQQNKEAVEFMREIEKELEEILEQGKIEMGALKLRAETAEAKLKALIDVARAKSDKHYIEGIRQLQRTECLGWEAKVRAGEFGQAEFDAHKRANEEFGASRVLVEMVKEIGALENTPK